MREEKDAGRETGTLAQLVARRNGVVMHDYGHWMIGNRDAARKDYRTVFVAGLKEALAAAGRAYCQGREPPSDMAISLDQSFTEWEAEARVARLAVSTRHRSEPLPTL